MRQPGNPRNPSNLNSYQHRHCTSIGLHSVSNASGPGTGTGSAIGTGIETGADANTGSGTGTGTGTETGILALVLVLVLVLVRRPGHKMNTAPTLSWVWTGTTPELYLSSVDALTAQVWHSSRYCSCPGPHYTGHVLLL